MSIINKLDMKSGLSNWDSERGFLYSCFCITGFGFFAELTLRITNYRSKTCTDSIIHDIQFLQLLFSKLVYLFSVQIKKESDILKNFHKIIKMFSIFLAIFSKNYLFFLNILLAFSAPEKK